MQALYQGLIATGVLSIGAVAAVIYFMVPDSVTDVAGASSPTISFSSAA
jgi:Na+/H+-translocating membrane pyrophosphatase